MGHGFFAETGYLFVRVASSANATHPLRCRVARSKRVGQERTHLRHALLGDELRVGLEHAAEDEIRLLLEGAACIGELQHNENIYKQKRRRSCKAETSRKALSCTNTS